MLVLRSRQSAFVWQPSAAWATKSDDVSPQDFVASFSIKMNSPSDPGLRTSQKVYRSHRSRRLYQAPVDGSAFHLVRRSRLQSFRFGFQTKEKEQSPTEDQDGRGSRNL